VNRLEEHNATGAPFGQPSHRLLFLWNPKSDTFHKQGESLEQDNDVTKEQIGEQISEYEDFFEWLLSNGIRDYRKVRREILVFAQNILDTK